MNDFAQLLFVLFWYAVFILLPGGALAVLMHFLLSLPMHRRDRALFFLDLLETVLQRGQPVEQAILSAAENHDRAIGIRFFVVAAHIEGGARLGEALEAEPRFLPPQVNAMLRTGEKLGDLKKVLPACREVLRVAPDTVRTTMHYMVAILLLFAPIACWIISLLSIYVIPRFKDVFAATDTPVWPLARFVFHIIPELVMFEAVIFLGLATVTAIYIGGPGFVRWFQFRAFSFSTVAIVDWISWRIPWKRKKLLRAFSAMLAVLLDGGVPEAVAVRLAGDCTANEICRRRAQRVIAALEKGVKLDEAVRVFDDSGEFHWRLTNASHARGGFLAALRGWHEALDAKAFQQEETATHMLTSGLVILNGLVVALIATSMFGMLVMILKGALASE
jgi:type II secretory pathway component PulF